MTERSGSRKGVVDRLLRETVLPTLEYAELQARITFDPLVRDAYAGSKTDQRRSKKLGIAGTPSALTIRLQEAIEATRSFLKESRA